MNPDAVRGHLDGLILAAVEGRPLHGYAIIEALRQRSGGRLDVPSGTIYPALRRLETSGLLESEWTKGTGRRRRVYALSTAGRRSLAAQRREWTDFVTVIGSTLAPVDPA